MDRSVEAQQAARGVACACAAYALWGLYPLYFKLVQQVPSGQILAHRVLWSVPLALSIVALRGNWRWIRQLRGRPSLLAHFGAAGLLLACNWGINIWAVNHGHVLDASLGYFLNPLLTIALGTMVLHEPLRRAQHVAVGVAAAGVIGVGIALGTAPWIALMLASTFAGYGLLRKTAPFGPVEGLMLETALILPLACAYLAWTTRSQGNAFVDAQWSLRCLLAAAGPVTAVPLLLFAAGARRIPLHLLGLLQYITPSVLLGLGVWLYREPFDIGRGIGFAWVWLGIAIYLGDRPVRPPAHPAARTPGSTARDATGHVRETCDPRERQRGTPSPGATAAQRCPAARVSDHT